MTPKPVPQKQPTIEDPALVFSGRPLAAYQCGSPLQAFCATRRSAKTTIVLYKAMRALIDNPGSIWLFLGLSYDSADSIVHQPMLEIADSMDVAVRHGTKGFTLKNGSVMLVNGTERIRSIQRRKGLKLIGASLDECSLYPPGVPEALLADAIGPALVDTGGPLIILGCPDRKINNFFYQAIEGDNPHGFDVFRWSWRDNPFICDQMGPHIDRMVDNNPDIVSTAHFRRNYLGEFCDDDPSDLLVQFSRDKHVAPPPDCPDVIHVLDPSGSDLILCSMGFRSGSSYVLRSDKVSVSDLDVSVPYHVVPPYRSFCAELRRLGYVASNLTNEEPTAIAHGINAAICSDAFWVSPDCSDAIYALSTSSLVKDNRLLVPLFYAFARGRSLRGDQPCPSPLVPSDFNSRFLRQIDRRARYRSSVLELDDLPRGIKYG